MDPSPQREPTVYAIRQALLDWYEADGGRLAVYFDLHAHTSRSVFNGRILIFYQEILISYQEILIYY